MGLREWLFGAPPEQRAAPVEERQSLDSLLALISGDYTPSGRVISAEGSLSQVTVFACVRLIAESVGMLPLIMYRRLEPRGKERATNHPLYTVLHDLPNPELTAIELYENMTGHLALWGNAYCEIEYDAAGRRRALWPLRPDRVEVGLNDRNQRTYRVSLPSGRQVDLERWRVWHVRGWGTDAWVGKSPIALAREAIGLAAATEEYGTRFFGNGSRPGGILKHPGKLSQAGANRLRESWESAHGGLSQSNRVAVLEEGVEWQQVGVPPEEAQFLETRKFQDTKICSMLRVPPHMISIVEGSTSWGTGIEQQSIGYVGYTLMPYLVRITQSIARDLLTTAERGTYFAEHLTAALVKGDINARYTAYNIGRMGGWLSVNDVREAENMNPVAGGDTYLQPLNMGPLGGDGEAGSGESGASSQNGNDQVDDSQNGNDGGDDEQAPAGD